MGIYSSCWASPRPFSLKPSKQQQQNAKIIVMFIFNVKKCGYLKISKNMPSLVFLYENVVLEQRIKRVIYKN